MALQKMVVSRIFEQRFLVTIYMPNKRLNQLIMELPLAKKLLLSGTVLMLISLFLPWYQDLDTFKSGEMFLGLTGPLYLAGFSVLILMALNLAMLYMEHSGRKSPLHNVKSSTLYLITGIASFYLLLMVNSVYFHQKFGINITDKQSDFGMFFAFIAASLITIGGYLTGRDKAVVLKEFEESVDESVIRLPNNDMRKPRENLRYSGAVNSNLNAKPANGVPAQKAFPSQQPTFAGKPEEAANIQPFRTDL